MNAQGRISSFIGMRFFFATASVAQQVKTDFDRSTDFSQYKTYSWEKVYTQDALWVDRIKEAVDSALAAKGWTQVESGGNVSIMAMEMTQSHQTLNTYYDGFGGGWGWRGGFGGGFGDDARGHVQSRNAGRRPVRLEQPEIDLARIRERHLVQQIQQEH